MPWTSNANMSAPNIQSSPPAESNLGNQLPQATASSSSHILGSVMECSTKATERSQSHGLASFYKPG
ncbi:hypothetical protein DdX_18025 [Ditylenchus destructor]|uniref:Uncharacterized protein n=1 Tax=Ditylenchus destructor TaxID=166010 RepID=A0AAD4MQ97_9BILA|nr:hypothetical protein DdX_18025 [Ditylenchus destructor]